MAKQGKFQQSRSQAQVATGDKPNRKTLRNVLLIVLAVLVALTAVVCLWGSRLVAGDTVFPHVTVVGVDVGGMTAEQAREAVENAVEQTYLTSTVEVQLPDRTLSFDPEQTNVTLNGETAIKEAMAFGRSKGAVSAVFTYLFARDREIPLQTALDMDTRYIQSMINRTAVDVRTAPVHTSMAVNAEMTEMEISVGVPGQELDSVALFDAVYESYQTGDFTPLVWDYTGLPAQSVDLKAIHDMLSRQATDARYDPEAHAIVDGENGCTFDLTSAQTALENAKPGVTITIDLEPVEPELTVGELTYEMFGQKLESRSSVYVVNPKRTENLRLACEAINGTIINPGEVFSFNEIVGERTAEKGYQPATVYGGEGESVEDLGGGICQVASTIYYAALYMDLEQVQREPHMYQVTYVPPGMDSTIYWGSKLDYQFRNNRENPIKIQANVDNGSCNITFWGVKENDNYVEMSYSVLSTTTDEPEEELDETKPVGFRELKQTAYTGAHVVAVQKVFDGSGKLLREEKIYSLYKSRPEIYIVGPSEDAPLDPENPDDILDPEDPWGDMDEQFPTDDPLDSPEFWT